MKKIFWGTLLLALSIVAPGPTAAGIDISIGIPLPPLFSLGAPPSVIPLPDTDSVYVVPDVDVDVFFWNGWWWMPWEGRWYRSGYYDRGWAYYSGIPRFYFDIDPDWRRCYRDHDWHGYRWQYERIPHHQLQQNWRVWHNSRHWERRGTWGVHNYRPQPPQQRRNLRYHRQQQYQQRPEVQRYLQQKKEQKSQPRVYQPKGQPSQRHQPRGQRPQVR